MGALGFRLLGVGLMCAVVVAAPLRPQAEDLVEAAEQAFRAGDLDSASALAERALDRNFRSVSAHMVHGLVAAQRHQWEAANQNLEAVVRLAPSNPYGYFHLGQAYLYQRKW